MPKAMFEDVGPDQTLLTLLGLLNTAMATAKNAKTVEDIQAVINNITRAINTIKHTIAIS
jgi:hypothetical protein